MQADIDKLIHVHLDGDLTQLLVKVNPTYKQFITYEHNKPIIYMELDKALCGTLQAALLFWTKLWTFLTDQLGFIPNPYDHCVVKKMINGSQCTAAWHVDDIKLSHIQSNIIDDLINTLNLEYGKETPLTIKRGKVHEYLRMMIDFSTPGQVQFSMQLYIDTLISECPDDIVTGTLSTLAGSHLFCTNPLATKLATPQTKTFHHLTAKLL